MRLLTDAVGRLKSKAKDYIHEVQTRVASQGNLIILHKRFSGGDLPEIAGYFDSPLNSSIPCDVNLIISIPWGNKSSQMIWLAHAIVCRRSPRVSRSMPFMEVQERCGQMWSGVVGRTASTLRRIIYESSWRVQGISKSTLEKTTSALSLISQILMTLVT